MLVFPLPVIVHLSAAVAKAELLLRHEIDRLGRHRVSRCPKFHVPIRHRAPVEKDGVTSPARNSGTFESLGMAAEESNRARRRRLFKARRLIDGDEFLLKPE